MDNVKKMEKPLSIKDLFGQPEVFFALLKERELNFIHIILFIFSGALSTVILSVNLVETNDFVRTQLMDLGIYGSIMKVSMFFFISGIIGMTITYILGTFILKLCSIILRVNVSLVYLLNVIVHLSAVTILGSFVNGILSILIPGERLNFTSLSIFTTESNALLFNILGEFDLFSLWSIGLLYIALKQCENISKKKVITVCIAFFMISLFIHLMSGNVPTRV